MSPIIRLLRAGEDALLEAFLARRWASSMILRSNARITPLEAEGPHHGIYAGAFSDGTLCAVAALYSQSHTMLLQGAPDIAAACAAQAAIGKTVNGLLGPWSCVTAAVPALGLDYNARLCGVPEVLYALDLAALKVPPLLQEGRWLWRRATAADFELIVGWRCGYCVETLGATAGPKLAESVRADMTRVIAEQRWFLLEAENTPVAMCGLSGQVPDAVQIGSVWTPVENRGCGYARGVVAGTLLAARADGVPRAALFTEEGNAPARRAYEALGFEAVGDYGMMLFA